MTVSSTRLRFISAKAAADLSVAVSSLPFKVEIKGAPVFDGTKWFLWFIIPDEVDSKFQNVEL